MKSILTLTALTLFSFVGFTQNWKEVKTNDTVKIYVKEIHYHDIVNDIDHQRLVFRYENLTAKLIEISFNRELIYNNKMYTQDEDFAIQIPANGISEYSESESKNKSFYIFKKDNKGWIKNTLDSYTFIHFKIK